MILQPAACQDRKAGPSVLQPLEPKEREKIMMTLDTENFDYLQIQNAFNYRKLCNDVSNFKFLARLLSTPVNTLCYGVIVMIIGIFLIIIPSSFIVKLLGIRIVMDGLEKLYIAYKMYTTQCPPGNTLLQMNNVLNQLNLIVNQISISRNHPDIIDFKPTCKAMFLGESTAIFVSKGGKRIYFVSKEDVKIEQNKGDVILNIRGDKKAISISQDNLEKLQSWLLDNRSSCQNYEFSNNKINHDILYENPNNGQSPEQGDVPILLT